MENPFKHLKEPVQRILPKQFKPRFITMGGEHLVFTFNELFRPKDRKRDARPRNVVGKVNFHDMMSAAEAELSGNPERVERTLDEIKQANDKKTSQMAEMRDYFGPDSVPTQQFMLRNLPVSQEVLLRLKPSIAQKLRPIDRVKAWVSIQQKIELPPDHTYSLTGYYPESPVSGLKMRGGNLEEKYDRGHDVLVGGQLSEFGSELQVSAVLDLYPELADVARMAESSPEFKAKLQEAARNMVRFSENADIPLELAGQDNVVLAKGKNGWKLKLMDALPLPGCSFRAFKRIIGKASLGERLSPNEAGIALNVLNTVRVINALALFADIPERLYIQGLEQIPAATWRRDTAQLFQA